ncbi:MAG: nucleotidyltransferase substrate binding protein [Vulcanococcus sp.]
MADADVRWQQRFANFCRALEQLELFFEPPALNPREQQGLVKAFEYTFELGWNSLRDLLRSRGNSALLLGSRDAIREAFGTGLLEDGPVWMEMVRDRNLTSHVYNRTTAEAITANISNRYLPAFRQLRARLQQLAAEEQA